MRSRWPIGRVGSRPQPRRAGARSASLDAARRPVPGAMLGGESIALILRWKLASIVESDPHRCRMRLDQHVRHGDLVLQVGPLPSTPRIFVGAQVIPGPAEEGTLSHAGDEIGNQVIAKSIALCARSLAHFTGCASSV